MKLNEFFSKFTNKLKLPSVKLILIFLDWKMYLKSIFYRDKVILNKNQTQEQRVHVVLALFEKEVFRKDILMLLGVLKDKNFYVSCVNSNKINRELIETHQSLYGTYIERFNYGRDFGSYKTGINHFLKKGNVDNTDVLLILNDSVFYSKKNLSQWLDNLVQSKSLVTGATENLEMEHHVGSFCVSVKRQVFKNKYFINYWKKYSETDRRYKVIMKGELKLSKVLKKCCSDLTQFKAYYNSEYFFNFITQDSSSHIRNNFLEYNRRVMLEGLGLQIPTLNLNTILQYIRRFVVEDRDLEESQNLKLRDVTDTGLGKSLKILSEKDFNFITTQEDIKIYLHKNVTSEYDKNLINKKVEDAIVFAWYENFRIGSQIHTNCILLPHLGNAIYKIDLIYRGVCGREDIKNLTSTLSKEESDDLTELLYSRPFGETSLKGWKKVAFMNGLI